MEEREIKTVTEAILQKGKLLIPLPLAVFVLSIALTITVYHLYTGVFGQVDPFLQRVFCLTLLLILCFIHHPIGRASWNSRLNLFSIADFVLVALSIFCLLYPAYDFEGFQFRMPSPSTMDIVWGTIVILLVMEASRRAIGWIMIIISGFFIVLCLFGESLPGLLRGPSVPWTMMIQVISMQDWGIFGVPMGVVTDYLILFMIFVEFLVETGAADVFVNLAVSIAGKWSGGPAKVSVFSSAFIGTISGSAVANVVADGPFNIPMMKKIGYKPWVAGAIEACTSTGGQIMPPVMGTAAFLMAEFLGVSYWDIAAAAIIPAVIFYASLFFFIHFEARKTGMRGLTAEERPSRMAALKASYTVLIPLILLTVIMESGYPVRIAAIAAILTVVGLSMIRKSTRLSPSRILTAMERGANSSIMVGIICAAAGIIIGGFYISGIQTLALAFTALVCLILGMAVTTTVVYILVYVFVIPILIQLGADPLTAHFYCFWWGVLAPITPPVGLAFYAAAGIAQCDPMRCGLSAMRIGIILYLLPFAMVYNPALVLHGTFSEIVIASFFTIVGTVGIASGLSGWLRYTVTLPYRILFVAGGMLLFYPATLSRTVGAVLFVIPLLSQLLKSPATAESKL
jgi:TRAP transporter 4TM/12TM fusion protein